MAFWTANGSQLFEERFRTLPARKAQKRCSDIWMHRDYAGSMEHVLIHIETYEDRDEKRDKCNERIIIFVDVR